MLDYVVTSNHIHLLVKDTGEDAIAQSMQLIAGRTAQEYNERKNRHGAFWEDRYHATAIEAAYSAQFGHRFRAKPAGYSGAKRPG